jgi:hypothetical protein
MKIENTKKSSIKSLKNGKNKNKNHSNISISSLLVRSLKLTSNEYIKIYVDETNNLLFEKL